MNPQVGGCSQPIRPPSTSVLAASFAGAAQSFELGSIKLTLLVGRRRLLLLFGLGALLLVAGALVVISVLGGRCGGLSGCDANGLPLGPVTVAQLDAHTEATLDYPGATRISHNGTPEQSTLQGPGLAYTVSILATPDAADRVYAWYNDWLVARGWRHGDVIRSTAELSVRSWDRGTREVFDVGILNPARMQSLFGNQIPSGQTMIETRYMIIPAGEVLPTPLPS